MKQFKIVAKIKHKQLDDNYIHFKVNGNKYDFQLSNEVYNKVLRMYKHTPGRAFNIAKHHARSVVKWEEIK